MDHFNNLPDEIIAKIYRQLLSMDRNNVLITCGRLHLVCRRWHSVCATWARHLPKSDYSISIFIENNDCKIDAGRGICCSKSMNCKFSDDIGDGPLIMPMLQHFNTTTRFGRLNLEKSVISSTHLLRLVEYQLLSVAMLAFFDCDMSGVTEDIMKAFFTALASSGSRLEELLVSNVKSAEVLFTDSSLAPIIIRGLGCLVLLNPSTFPCITDETLTNYAKGFHRIIFQNLAIEKAMFTARGVHQLIEAHHTAEKRAFESYLRIPSQLKSELFKLRVPDDKVDDDYCWIYKKFPKELHVQFY